MCKGEATCAFSNIANLCYHLTHDEAGELFKNERYTSGRKLVEDYFGNQENWDRVMNSKFFIGCQLLREKFRYEVIRLKDDFDVLRDSEGYYVVVLKSTNNLATRHVVSIADGHIIDGLFTNMVELTKSNLDKICGHVDRVKSPKFDGILAGYEVKPPAKVKQRIDVAGSWCLPKEKVYFQEYENSDSSDDNE